MNMLSAYMLIGLLLTGLVLVFIFTDWLEMHIAGPWHRRAVRAWLVLFLVLGIALGAVVMM